MRAIRRIAGGIVAAVISLGLALMLYAAARGRPQDLPWTALDLSQPIGLFTGRKLTGLGHNFAHCRALLRDAGVRYAELPPVSSGNCGYTDGIRLAPGGALSIKLAPDSPALACPVAAAISVWEWDVLQPAALKHFHSRVIAIDHYGSYNCRRIYGREAGPWSEHAGADAIDVAGFLLSDGTRIEVARDWKPFGAKGAFLRDARAGACKLFATVLSPDYNAAHHDHLHLDQAARGEFGWRACR